MVRPDVARQLSANRILARADLVVRNQPSHIIYPLDLLRSVAMRAFLLACAAAIVIAAAAFVVLDQVQEPVQQAFATTGVRL